MGNSNDGEKTMDTFEHPRLGTIKKVQQYNANQYILYEMILQNKKIYDDWIKELQSINNDEDIRQILFLPVHQEFQQTSYCGTGGTLKLNFQDYFYSILPEIQNRKGIKRPFSQQELLYLFYSLIKISTLLQAKNRTIGDVKPQNILVNEDGYIKIISSISWPSQPMKIAHSWQKAQERLFLSPEQCEDRTKKKDLSLDNYQNRYSEIYSIGLTILQAGTLRDCSEIYGSHKICKFSQIKLIEYLDTFQSRYSKEFFQIVKEMLHIIPKKRWRPGYIYEVLKPYEHQIMNLEQISIKLDRPSSIPRIQRQQKISIKKIGQSINNLSQYSQKSKLSNTNSRDQQLIKQISQKKQQKQSLIQSNKSNYNFWSHTHQNNPMLMNHNIRYNNQSQQYSKFHQYSNFGKNMSPIQHNQVIQMMPVMKNNLNDNRMMAISMPLDLAGYQQQNRSKQHYITQNSMMALNSPIYQSRQI